MVEDRGSSDNHVCSIAPLVSGRMVRAGRMQIIL